MNPFQFEVTCEVCGEPGMGTIRCLSAGWMADGSQVRHVDPGVCAANLERKRVALERREAELTEKEKESGT